MTPLERLAGADPELSVLVVCAHPDDETIGMGGLLSALRNATVLHVTDGAPRKGHDAAKHGFASTAAYAAARRREALAALAVAGVPEERALTLGFADQEAALHLVPMAHRITEVLRSLKPGIVVTQAYEGGHPDHDAVAVGVRAALRELRAPPPLVEMTGYHAGGPQGIETGVFLPPTDGVVELPRDAAREAAKRRMLDCFVTQREVLSYLPLGVERLRPAPPLDVTRPPHEGQLFYERFPWGWDGTRFRLVAKAALDGLGLPACL